MKALKAVVILMAVVLVVGFTALIYMWQQKRAEQTVSTETVAPLPAAPVAAPADDVTVMLPAGARVMGTASAGNRIDVLVQNADGSQDLYQVSRADGSVLGTIRFRHEAPE